MENQTVTSEGLEVGQITGNLKVIKCLQEREFGRVFQVMDIRSEREFVTKEMKLDQDLAKSEVSIHRKLTHPNVIQFFEVRSEDDLVYIDMELGASCLYDVLYIDRHVLFDGWQYFRDLIDGVEYLHSMGVAHRNIKPENLLIGSDGRLKIADFGLASSIGRKTDDGRGRGTRQYLAPEVIREERYRLEPVDIWACGIVLIEMLSNRLPWDSVDSSRYSEWKLNRLADPTLNNPQYPFNLIYEPALDLIVFMLKEDPNVRATIHDIKNHTWFMNGFNHSLILS